MFSFFVFRILMSYDFIVFIKFGQFSIILSAHFFQHFLPSAGTPVPHVTEALFIFKFTNPLSFSLSVSNLLSLKVHFPLLQILYFLPLDILFNIFSLSSPYACIFL